MTHDSYYDPPEPSWPSDAVSLEDLIEAVRHLRDQAQESIKDEPSTVAYADEMASVLSQVGLEVRMANDATGGCYDWADKLLERREDKLCLAFDESTPAAEARSNAEFGQGVLEIIADLVTDLTKEIGGDYPPHICLPEHDDEPCIVRG